MRSRALAALLGVACAAIACAGNAPLRAATAASAPRSEIEAEQSAPAHTTEADVTSPCVVHAGDIHTDTTRRRGPGGAPGPVTRTTRCAYNAECVVRRGSPSPGDGLVSLECEGRACLCRIESFGRAQPIKREFTFEAECESAQQAQQLLKERCIEAATRHASAR